MEALGFYEVLKERGADDLGLALVSEEKKTLILSTLAELFATGSRDRWVELLRAADIVSAPINTLLEASNDPDVLANGYVAEKHYPEAGETLKVHGTPWRFSETPRKSALRRSSASTTLKSWPGSVTMRRHSKTCANARLSEVSILPETTGGIP